MPIAAELQDRNQVSPFIELYKLDCTPIGGTTYYFTPHFADGGTIAFNGITYNSIPIVTDGWELTSTGTQPRPTLAISNVLKTLLAPVISLEDIVGCKVTRTRTYEKYLDGKPGADTTQYLPPEVYYIEQKTSHDNEIIAWQLSSALDRLGMMLPRRQITATDFPGVGRSRGVW